MVSDSLKNSQLAIETMITPTADQMAYPIASGIPLRSARESIKKELAYPVTTTAYAHHLGFSPAVNLRKIVAITSVMMAIARKRYASMSPFRHGFARA